MNLAAVHDEIDEVRLEVRDLLCRADAVGIFRQRFVCRQHVAENLSRFQRSALILPNDSERLRFHLRTVLLIVEKTNDFIAQLLIIVNGNAGAALGKECVCILEVEHIVPDDDGLAMCRRLQDIMTAVCDERTADVNDIADGIDLAELANRIEDDDICCLRHLTLLKRRTPGTGKARILYEVHDLCYAEKLAWRNDESRFRMLFPNPFERL